MKNENTIFVEAYPDIYLAVSEYFENREIEDDFFENYAINFIKRLAYLQRNEQCVPKWLKFIRHTFGTATDEFNVFVYCAINITPKDSVLHDKLEKNIYYKQPDKFIEVLNKYKDKKRQPLPPLVFSVAERQKNKTIYTTPPALYKRETGGQFDLANCTQNDLEYLFLIINSEDINVEICTPKADECIKPDATANNPFAQTILDAFQYINGSYDFDKNTYLIKQYIKRKATEAKQQGYEYKEFLLKSIEFVEALKFHIYAIATLKINSISDSDKPMPGKEKERLTKLLKQARNLIAEAKDIKDTANEILSITIKQKIKAIIFTIEVERQRIPYSQIRLVFLALKELEKELSKPTSQATPAQPQLADLIKIKDKKDKAEVLKKIDKYIEPKTAKQIYIIREALRKLNYIGFIANMQVNKAICQQYNIKISNQVIEKYKDYDLTEAIEIYTNYLKV